ncbi:hypothetical protein FKM82_004964 [Ascaphus truei]
MIPFYFAGEPILNLLLPLPLPVFNLSYWELYQNGINICLGKDTDGKISCLFSKHQNVTSLHCILCICKISHLQQPFPVCLTHLAVRM